MTLLRSSLLWLAVFALILAACAQVPLTSGTEAPGLNTAEEPLGQPTRETPPVLPVRTPTRSPSGPTSGEDLPEAVEKAIATFSLSLGADVGDVNVISYEETTFTDSCLGLGGPAEMCLQALTPGYIIHLEVGGETYEVHTDKSGENVRTKSTDGPLIITPGAEQSIPVLAALRALSESEGVSVGDIEIVSVEEVEWSDSCLGLGGPAEICAAAITPGFLVILQAAGTEYEFHTDLSGENVRQK